MKSFAAILIFFLALHFAYAETKIFSGKVLTDADKVIDGNTFRFNYEPSSDKAFVQTPAGNLIVENGACKPNSVFRVCINNANFSHKNITTYVYYYEIDATIYKLTGSLTTSSKSALGTLLQSESTELTVTITNPTEFDITNIVFNYDLGQFFTNEAKGCELNNNQLSWKGSLQPKYDKTCSVTITADKEGKYSLSGNLSYFNGFETEKKATDSLAIAVLPKQLKVNQFIDTDIWVERPFYFNISLQNIHSSEDINALATITIPSHVSLIKDTPVFEKSARVLKQSFMLKPNASIIYLLYMEKLSDGKEPINLRFAYTIKGVNDAIENNTFIDVISAPTISKPAEAKQEKPNETKANLTAASGVQASPAASENKTTGTKSESGNKTAEQVAVITDIQKPKSFNKNILLISIIIFAAFLTVLLIVFKIKKGKKKDELMEKLEEELKPDEMKPKNF